MALPIVAIVGRPNVGKSTLVNRIAQTGDAIVHEMRGVTRDRSYHKADWNGVEFMLIDTGGIEMGGDDAFQGSIRAQAFEGAREADVIIFLVDGKAGINTDDEEVARILQKAGKPVFVAVNKMDNPARMDEVWEFYALGLGDPWPVSAQHGNGTGDLLDEVVNELRKVEIVPEEEVEAINVAIIGRPNAGKSSLTNKLTNNNRSIVSDVAGTTRDAIDTPVDNAYGKFIFTDTAGLRKRSNITDGLERYMVVRALAAVERSRVALILVDATVGFTEQDSKVAGYAHDQGKACIIVVNKWDAVEGKETNTMELQRRGYAECFSFMGYAPIIFISAQTGYNVNKLMQLIRDVDSQNGARVPTGVLNEIMMEAVAMQQPPSDKGKRLKLYYITQVSVKPPTFVIFVNDKELMHFSYTRYLENKIREAFGFKGTSLKFFIRERKER